MNSMKVLILILMIFSSIICQEDTEAIEFEENLIKSDFQQFSYKTIKTSMIILIAKNSNLNINSYDEKILTIYNKNTKESKDYQLSGISYIVFDDIPNEKELQYIFKFKNYNEGNFIVYSSANSFPLKQIEKGFSLQYYFSSGKKDINLTFHTNILKDDILLDIYPGEKIKVKKISNTGSEEIVQIKNNVIKLSKDYKYAFEYYYYTNQFEIAIKKRELINYNKNSELKLNLYNHIPNFILIKLSEYNNDIIYSYLYYYDYISYDIEISEIESDKIDNWENIEFTNKTRINTQNVYEIYTKSLNKTYILIKLTIIRFLLYENKDYFYTFKIFQNYRTNLEPIISQEETLVIYEAKNKMIFIQSDVTNLRTFENKEAKSVIYQRESEYFPFIIMPTEKSFSLSNYGLYKNLYGEIYLNEKSFHNYLYREFDSVIKPEMWYFDINEPYTLYINSYFGYPKIYYSEIINQEIIDDMEEKKFKKVKEYNISHDIITFNSPFALYIDPYENSYLNFILSKDNDLNINNEVSNKYLINNKEYNFHPKNKLMVSIDDNFLDSNIDIIKDGEIISKLNKENPSIKIDESNQDLTFKSDKDVLINLYYDINNLFFDEEIKVITFPKDKIGQIMIVKILLSKTKSYYYAINYGYDGYLPPDTKKIATTQTYFYIEDPYSIIENKIENLNHYLILFGQNINYEISFIKKYEKEKNTFYYKIKGDENYRIISELNYPSDYFTYELLLCENKDVNITILDIYNRTEKLFSDKILINQSNKKALFTFESQSDFIFFQKENEGHRLVEPEIEYFIPKIENNKISLLLINEYFELNTQYSVILLEDDNKDDELKNKFDNECFLFSLINNEIKYLNYDISDYVIYEGRFLYEEIDYKKFIDSKALLIKIYSCKNEKNICVFSKSKRIFLENLIKNNNDEPGITKIEEFKEYKVTKDEYIFSYDYKNYLNSLEDMFLYITTPTQKISNNDYIGQIEIINPLMETFILKYRYTETIPLIKNQHIKSNGKYYFIFKNCSSVTFYLHNTLNFFPLNKINNYISETDYKTTYGDGLIYFEMHIEEDKYIYLEWNTGQIYLYSILNKTTEKKSYELYNAHYIKKGSYLLILEYGKNYLGYHFSININHYLLNIEQSKEIKVDMGIYQINQPTITAVVDLSKYDEQLYLVSDSKFVNIITCEKNMDIESIIENGRYGGKSIDTHIIKIDEINQEKCDPPYYNIKLYNSRFELISEVYEVDTNQNFTFRQKDTIAFTIKGNGFNLVLSNQENIKWLDKMQNEDFNMLLSNEQIQFKLKPNEDTDTNLRIKILENKYNISFNFLSNNEISKRIRYNNDTKEIKYYINLSKNKYLVNHFDYSGNLEFYISKEEINENNIEEILKANDINMDIFEHITKNKFEIDKNKILAIKKEKNIFSELLIAPLFNDFIIDNSNSKFILENKKYYMISNVTILLEENSDAEIKIYDLNDSEIYSLNKNNPTFENKIYNKTLYLKSNIDTLIYIYYQIKENSKNFINQKNDNILIILSSDCRDKKLKYCIDNGFENYIPNELNLIDLKTSKMFINSLENNETIIQKGTDYMAYIQCEYDLINNYSDFYKNSTLNEGSYLLENNIYLNSNLYDNRKNIFYQIYKCSNDINNEFYASIDEMELKKLNIDVNSFITGDNQIEFYLKVKNECFFNYYKTKLTEEDYNDIEKNNNHKFNISFISRNSLKIDLLPKYKKIDFEFYIFIIFIYLDKENKTNDNSLSNKCYLKKLISNDNDNINNVIIKKIEYKNGKINNDTLDISLESDYFMHINILGKGIILDNIEEYIFYEEQIHKIEDSDFPNDGLSIWAIIGIALGAIALIVILVLVYLKCRKHNKMDLSQDNKNYPLALDNEN